MPAPLSIRPRVLLVALPLAVVWSLSIPPITPPRAQTPAQDAAAAPALRLSEAQRLTVFQSVSHTRKNHAAPTGFRASVGAHVPASIELRPVPDAVADLIPETRAYAVAMVEKQVMFADPRTRQVVAVVTGDP